MASLQLIRNSPYSPLLCQSIRKRLIDFYVERKYNDLKIGCELRRLTLKLSANRFR